jgi:hypothetical protein
VRVSKGEVAKKIAERPRADERLGVDLGVPEQFAAAQPVAKRPRRRNLVDRPDGDLGVDEVLDEVERRGRRGTAGGLESSWNRFHR